MKRLLGFPRRRSAARGSRVRTCLLALSLPAVLLASVAQTVTALPAAAATPPKGDRCTGRDSHYEGEARPAFRDCAGPGPDWLFEQVKGYQIGNPMSAVDTLHTYLYSGELGFGTDNWTVPRLAVMPLGDSITEGVGSTTRSGYRAQLWNLLQDHAPVVDFVGSQQHGQLPDPDHEGHSGWLIEGLAAHIDTWLAAARPHVVLLHIGTNDLDRDHQVATAPARLAALIDQIIAASPDTAISVASLVPSASPAVQSRINAYNATIPGIVAARQVQGHKVSYVPMSTALTTGDLTDRLHPNNTGYLKMARVFADGISRIAQAGQLVPEAVVGPAAPRTSLGAISQVHN
ncbi:SGNH/GDSL hydrolase family protein [Streptomyces sp. NPDC048442]|uniref:SGNH/GDSL hydrolase family protein n=1 Tax=Streptomyces sp. NPDC048442 TaxID=3154823 RepID=UPI003414A85D